MQQLTPTYKRRKRKKQESVYASGFSKTVPLQLNQSKDSKAEIIPEEYISRET